MKVTLLCVIALMFSSLASSEEWSAKIGKKKFSNATKALPGKVSAKLDFGAYQTATDLVVYLRNGKNKMGPRSISINCADSPATIEVQRVLISKPLIDISKEDGSHVFETFKNSAKTYEVHYHIKDGKLEPKITISSKS